MAEERAQRRLAAILAADVAGYSRLMGADEKGTLSTLRSHREALDRLIALHHGRVFGSAGDSVIAEFASAVEAIEAAVEIQQETLRRNEGVPPDKRFFFRIGINIGDVMVAGDNLFGDGVNVAARVQALAKPGGICVSRNVYNQVKNKVPVAFEDLGEHRVKNIVEPLTIYRLLTDSTAKRSWVRTWLVALRRQKLSVGVVGALLLIGLGAAVWYALPRGTSGGGQPAIAVLPLDNIGYDEATNRLADGLSEDIITDLARFQGILVIARNSTLIYKGRAVDVRQVGKDLDVGYVLEGSIQRHADQIRITAQLIDAAADRHLWAERYDRTIDDLFEVQDEVVRAVVTTLEHRIADTEAEQRRRKPPHSWIAYDHYLQARQLLTQYASYLKAEAPLRKAIELDPRMAEAYAKLVHVAMAKFWLGADESHLEEAWSLANKALAIDSKDSSAHGAMALVSAFMNRLDLAWLHTDRALALNPNNVVAASNRAAFLNMSGRSDEALAVLEQVRQRDPFPSAGYWETLGTAFFQLHRYQESIDAFSLIVEPQYWERAYLIAAFALSGRLEEARRQLIELKKLHPDIAISRIQIVEIYYNAVARDHFAEGLRKAGMPD